MTVVRYAMTVCDPLQGEHGQNAPKMNGMKLRIEYITDRRLSEVNQAAFFFSDNTR